MPPTAKEIVQEFRESIPAWASQSTRYKYPRVAAQFVTYIGAKDTYTKKDAVRWLNHLTAEKKSKGHIRWSAYVLTSFYKSLELPAPFKSREYPPAPTDDELVESVPALSKAVVQEMIEAVKARGTPRMQAYLVLSTTYGLRAEEMARITNGDIDNGTLMIRPLKSGSDRMHRVPGEIVAYLEEYDFPKLHPQSIINMFLAIQKLTGHKHKNREGWHSIRRRLIQELADSGVEERHRYSFMRWKAARRGIMGVYEKPKPDEAEDIVFNVHPFINEWS